MPLTKREQAHIERRLVAVLTEACETAKTEVVGFSWLTHKVNYAVSPSSLMVVWVFDTQVQKDQALARGQGARMVELTSMALSQLDVVVRPVVGHVRFDTEEQCQRENSGSWKQRLACKHSVGGKWGSF